LPNVLAIYLQNRKLPKNVYTTFFHMKALQRLSLIGLVLTASVIQAYATWSIILIDPQTKAIGIAGASCTYSVYGIGSIVPGKGAVVVQASGAARTQA